MNVASLDLCRELYELSGWEDTSFGYFDGDVEDRDYAREYGRLDAEAPAYDLGYLLRKLPQPFAMYLDSANKEWIALTGEKVDSQRANTPEDAAAKLAIELFKQGIMTKAGRL